MKRHRGAYWVKVGRLRGLGFAVQVVRRGKKFYASSRVGWEGRRVVEAYRMRQGVEEIFRGLKQELGWVGPLVHGRKPVPKGIVHRHRRRGRLLVHLALGLVAYGLIELLLSPNEVRGVAAGAVQVEFLPVSAKTDGREANPGSEPFASGVVATA